MWVMMILSVLDLWNLCPLRISYSHSTMTNDERMQRESNLIATIRKELPEFAKACADDTELVLLHQDAFALDYQEPFRQCYLEKTAVNGRCRCELY
jgi:hypothetical protein